MRIKVVLRKIKGHETLSLVNMPDDVRVEENNVGKKCLEFYSFETDCEKVSVNRMLNQIEIYRHDRMFISLIEGEVESYTVSE